MDMAFGVFLLFMTIVGPIVAFLILGGLGYGLGYVLVKTFQGIVRWLTYMND